MDDSFHNDNDNDDDDYDRQMTFSTCHEWF